MGFPLCLGGLNMEAKAMDLNKWSVVGKELRDLIFVS